VCSPFYLDAVRELEAHVDALKIASYELLWDDLLRACAGTGKPVMLSTGMATLDEVERAVSVLRSAGTESLTLLHCVSSYPAKAPSANLAAISTMRETFSCPVGWSDHSVNPAVIYRAVHAWGASAVEFHLDLDEAGIEFSGGHCWLPGQIADVIRTVRSGLGADGTGQKDPAEAELGERDWRADPADGLRPLRGTRDDFRG
jgi:N-acetylneuraminate synthase